jgi:hypothetical protein
MKQKFRIDEWCKLIMNHEPYQLTFEYDRDIDAYYALIKDFWGRNVSDIAFMDEIDGEMWPVYQTSDILSDSALDLDY